MAEIQSSSWAETAASNNTTVPDGWPEDQLPSTVNNCAREMMAAIKRDWNRSHVTISSTGSANAYVLTYANAPTYTHGIRLSFKANFANTGAATANANALGAKSIVRNDGATALVANDIVINQHVDLEYDSALDKLVMLTPLAPAAIASITLGTPVATTSGTSVTFTGIPSGAKQVTMLFSNVSMDATAQWSMQIGDAGGIETTGYLGGSVDGNIPTTYWSLGSGIVAASPMSGVFTMYLANSTNNTWCYMGTLVDSNTGTYESFAGTKSLSAELTQIKLSTAAGTAVFDLGEVNITYQ